MGDDSALASARAFPGLVANVGSPGAFTVTAIVAAA
jgi:hypothetical protein